MSEQLDNHRAKRSRPELQHYVIPARRLLGNINVNNNGVSKTSTQDTTQSLIQLLHLDGYPVRAKNLILKAYEDMSQLSVNEKNHSLKFMLVEIWKRSDFEKSAAATCSTLIQKEMSDKGGDECEFFCVVEDCCADLIRDCETLAQHLYQWEKFLKFLFYLSNNLTVINTTLGYRSQKLITQSLNASRGLFKFH